jgi:hypothetical protein
MKQDVWSHFSQGWGLAQLLLYLGAAVVVLHGLIHLLGFVAYWPMAGVASLPYKTTLLGGHWEVGLSGMRWFAVLWLVVALGYVGAVGGLVGQWEWWRGTLLAVTLLSLAITALDWANARVGALVDVVILAVLLLGPRVTE